ncbi:MAG TPA: hypothetical protein VFB38_22535 [Chthonomonadaceae bacterium]|nr:hypothetical protein [Chthonomonadaceae bacterium]
MAALVGLLLAAGGAAKAAQTPAVFYRTAVVRVGGRSYRCNVVTINLASGKLAPCVVTAQGGVGQTEAFAQMVRRARAVAAINGSFFEAYNKTGDKDPVMTLIHAGKVVHRGRIGTVVGFGPRGAVMGRLDLPIRGTVTRPMGRLAP